MWTDAAAGGVEGRPSSVIDAQTAASQDINCFSAAFASFFGSKLAA